MKAIPITVTREEVFALQRVLKVANQCECSLDHIDVKAVLRVIKAAQYSYAHEKARSQLRSAASLA